ncbi:SMC4 [Candida oxycetoniae]|uniref:Structural maintenance of chromosomes protein n=1 Tax=Candida oxycetoniae TaxID=497107 RepID=A0AAI9WY38_9ASCO|nr:SMC4 [Candida oxycetoniae]KAI3404877.2 SMC4 [Candida oxycetoniae]
MMSGRRALPSTLNTPTAVRVGTESSIPQSQAETLLTEFIDASEYNNNPFNVKKQNQETGLASNNGGSVPLISQLKRIQRTIKQLVLTNFKSYAGRQVIGPFHTSFSSVVGPNGSGKSNVIDSMLFVFGFKANKMRQGKISELIHNSGDETRPEFCQVDIHFEMVLDGPPLEVVHNSQLVISRKAFQNNQSQYYLDGKKSTYTEVTTLLKQKGVDLDHKRFLILQGEVESIAQMKPKGEKEGDDDGLLEYLEDIIGTTKYKKLIEDSMVQIEELNTMCQEKSDRFAFVEKDKLLLDERKVEALRFLELEKKLEKFKSMQKQYDLRRYKREVDQKEGEVQELSDTLEKKRLENANLLKSIDNKVASQAAINKQVKTLVSELGTFQKEKKTLNQKSVSFEEKQKSLETKLKKANKSVTSSTQSLANANQKLSTYSNSSSQYKCEIDALTNNLQREEEKLTSMREKLTQRTSTFTNEIEDLQKKLDPWTSKLKNNENQIQLTQSNIDMLETQMNRTKMQLEESKNRLREIKQEGKNKETQLQEKELDLERIIEQTALGEEQTNSLKVVLDKLKAQITKQKNKLSDSLAVMQTKENKNSVLAALTKLAKSGRIDDFYGRLGDLGTIDEQYDVAISTAAAPGLDSMVVETVETAQTCIEYLRKNKLGYANFICLNKLSKFDLSKISTPGDPSRIKRLFDLITPVSDKFAPAFFSKMFNTLVAPTLSEAKAVAYGAKRWKVVTLDGKVIDTFGTMSGGGYVQRGAMKLGGGNKVVGEVLEHEKEIEIEDIRVRLRELEQKHQEVKKEYDENMAALQQVKALEPETKLALDKLQLDIAGLASEMKEIAQFRKSLALEQEQMETDNPFEKQISEKKGALASLNEERNRIKSEMADSENRILLLEQKIMEAGGVELKVQNSRVDSIKQQISIINDKTSGDRIAIKKLESDVQRYKRLIEEATLEKDILEKDLLAIQQSHKSLLSQMVLLDEKIQALDQHKRDKDEELEIIRVDIEGMQEELSGFKQFEVDTLNQVEKITSVLRKLNHLVDENERALENTAVRDVEPYIYWMDNNDDDDRAKFLMPSPTHKLSPTELDDVDIEAVNSEVDELEKYMANVRVDIEILKEYGAKIVEYQQRKDDLNKAVQQRDTKRDYCEDLKKKRLDEFMQGFMDISMTLKDMYRMITMGGNAELELVDSLDPFSEGILFSVMPPKKSWKNISNLSGGEKTLSSLALVFALHKYKPTPLYVMDEIDAALDFRNVSIVANYIKERTKNAQFVVISLRNNMFELAQKLIGIYKVKDKTTSVALLNGEMQ